MPSLESPESSKITSESDLTSTNSTPQTTEISPSPLMLTPGKSENETAAECNAPPAKTQTPRELRGADGAAMMTRRNKASLDSFEDSIGGRDNLIDTLSLSTLDKKQEHFLRLICDPKRAHDSLVTIARDAGLLPTHVLDLFRNASVAKAHALAMGQLSEALPAIARDIADKSIDAKVECPACFGDKYIREGVECPQCNGRGEVFRTSDLDRQKIALETTGILKKGSGVNVNVNQQVGVISPGTFFSKYVKASDDAAYDVPSDAIDVKAEDVS